MNLLSVQASDFADTIAREPVMEHKFSGIALLDMRQFIGLVTVVPSRDPITTVAIAGDPELAAAARVTSRRGALTLSAPLADSRGKLVEWRPGSSVSWNSINGRESVELDGRSIDLGRYLQVLISVPGDLAELTVGDHLGGVGVTKPVSSRLVLELGCGHYFGRDCGELELAISSSSRASLGNVAGDAHGAVTSSARVSLGSVGGHADLRASSSGTLSLGGVAQTATLRSISSSRISAGDLSDGANLSAEGSGRVSCGRVNGSVVANVVSSGELQVGQVAGDAMVEASASGRATLHSVTGRLVCKTKASGKITVESGTSASLKANAVSSGRVVHRGTVLGLFPPEPGAGGTIIVNGKTYTWSPSGTKVDGRSTTGPARPASPASPARPARPARPAPPMRPSRPTRPASKDGGWISDLLDSLFDLF